MEENNKNNIKNEIRGWIKSISLAIIIAFLLKTFIFNTTYVLGSSMHPTLHEKDRLLANKISLYFSEPERGDIIIFKAPDDEGENKDYIKRVIAIEGDTVDIFDGDVYLNGTLLEENYIEEGSYTDIYNGKHHWEIPKDSIFVLGDNRGKGESKDSRIFGYISVDSVKGITNFRYFPINQDFGKL